MRALFVLAALCALGCTTKPKPPCKGLECVNTNVETKAPTIPRPVLKAAPRLPVGNIYFAFNADTLTENQIRFVVPKLAKFMGQNPGTRLSLSGYADTVGSDFYNTKLSLHRAMAVKTALVLAGAPESSIDPYGLGELKGNPSVCRKVSISFSP